MGYVQGGRRVLHQGCTWSPNPDMPPRSHTWQLKVPDDITILFTDDNYGNLVTVQPPDKAHPAGAGMYYHVDCKSSLASRQAVVWKLTCNRRRSTESLQVDQHHQPRQEWVPPIPLDIHSRVQR